MKISISIDCTPDEARGLLGIPDLSAPNEAFAEAFKEKMMGYLGDMDPETVIKTWFPSVQGLEDVQKAFWEGFTGTKAGAEEEI